MHLRKVKGSNDESEANESAYHSGPNINDMSWMRHHREMERKFVEHTSS